MRYQILFLLICQEVPIIVIYGKRTGLIPQPTPPSYLSEIPLMVEMDISSLFLEWICLVLLKNLIVMNSERSDLIFVCIGLRFYCCIFCEGKNTQSFYSDLPVVSEYVHWQHHAKYCLIILLNCIYMQLYLALSFSWYIYCQYKLCPDIILYVRLYI